MSRNIIDVNAGEGALLLNDPIKFTNNVNLNFYYGPYGWKADDGTIPKKYFEYKSGRTTTRYPSESTKNIRPSGKSEDDCFIIEDNELVYKNSESFGYALACVLLGKANEAPAGTTFGVADDNNEVIEYTYDGVINNVPMAHVKIDIDDLVDETVQQVQSIIPTFVDKDGHTITDLGTYFEEQLGDFIKEDTLNEYTRRDSIFVDGLIDVNKIPTLNTGQIPQLDMNKITGISTEFEKYAKTSALTDFVRNDKLFYGDKILLDKLPDDVSSKVISIDMNKINGLNNEFGKYATTSKLLDYTKTSDLFDGNNQFKIDIPVNKISGIENYAKTSNVGGLVEYYIGQDQTIQTAAIQAANQAVQTALDDDQRMTGIVEGVVSGRYLEKSEYTDGNGRLVAGKIPDLSAQYASTSELTKYATTSKLLDYTKSSDLFENGQFKINIPVNKITGINAYQTTSDLTTKLGAYTKTSDLFEGGEFKINVPVSKITGIGKYAETSSLTAYQTTADLSTKLSAYTKSSDLFEGGEFKINVPVSKISGIGKYAETSSLTAYQTTADLSTKLSAYTKSSDLFDTNNTFKIDVPVGKVNGLDSRLNGFATTSSLKEYAQTSSLGNFAKTSDLTNLATKDLANIDASVFNTKVQSVDLSSKYATTGSLSNFANKDLSNINADDFGTKVQAVDLSSKYATTATLKNYAQTSALDNLATKDLANIDASAFSTKVQGVDLSGKYATTGSITNLASKDLSNIDTTVFGNKVKGVDLSSKYATTGSLSNFADKNLSNIDADAFGTKVQGVDLSGKYATTGSLKNYAQTSALTNLASKDLSNIDASAFSTKVQGVDLSGKYATTGSLKTYAQTSSLAAYQTTADMNKYQTTSSMGAYQLTSGMKNYATTSNVATKDLSNVTTANFASKMVNSGGVTTTSLSRAISESEAIQTPLANEAIEDVVAEIEVEQGDLSLDRLRNIFKNVKIPEIAIQSVKSNTSVYGYAVISDISGGGANMLTGSNSSRLAYASTIIQKINDVDHEFEGYTGKYIYLIPCISKKDNLKSWTKTSLSKDMFNVVKSQSNCPYYYYTPNTSPIYTKVTSSTVYADVKDILYYCDENEFIGIFDCYWVDRKTAYEQTVANAQERVKKLPFVKTIKTTDYVDNGSKETYKTATFITQYGTYNDSHAISVTADSVTGSTVYDYIVHEIGDEDSPILSGLTASHLGMYSTSYSIELVTEFHNGKSTTALLTLDVSGDGLGDLNDEIVEIMDKSTGASVVDFDTSGNTDYYYEVIDNYNANKYTTTAKTNVEDTIRWYNENMWTNTSKNVIYLFCYKDAPAKLSDGTDCYGYYFRAIAYMNNSVVPLDWRPCIPYSLSGKQLNYPAIVDLSGTSTTIGLPSGESVSFNSTMTTDDRVNAFLYRSVTTQVPEYSDKIIPGTPEKRTIETAAGILDAIEASNKFVNERIDTTNAKRFDNMKILSYVDAHMASLIPAFRQYVTNNKLVAGTAALILASAILKRSDYKQFAEGYYSESYRYYINNKARYEEEYFSKYNGLEEMLTREMDYGTISQSYPDILKAIASGIIGQITGSLTPRRNYILLFIFSKLNKVLKNYVLVYWDFWQMVFEGQEILDGGVPLEILSSCDIATENQIGQIINETYVMPEGIVPGVGSRISAAKYTAAKPDTTETVTTYKPVTVIEPRKPSGTGSKGFTYSDYTYTNGTETETGNTRDWFKANTIVRFLVKKTSNKKVYEYRKWNKYTQTWSDLGVEDYVTTEESSGSGSGSDWVAPYHDPHPVLAGADERISNRDMYEVSNSIAKLQNDVASDMSTTNDNIAMMVNRINELTAIINSMTGVSASDRIKALVSTDNKTLSVSTENGPSVQGLSSAYTTTQDISGASTATDNVDTSVRSTVSVDMNTVNYKKSHQMPILKS